MAIRHIDFDIGNVPLNFDPEYTYLDLIPDQVERKAFLIPDLSNSDPDE